MFSLIKKNLQNFKLNSYNNKQLYHYYAILLRLFLTVTENEI